MSFISAGNTTTTTLVVNGDTTGNLVFNTGGANTTALTIDNTQNTSFANTVTTSSLNAASTLSLKTANTTALTVTSGQAIGIGTASPVSKLTVSSGTNNGIVVTDGTVSTILYNTSSTSGSIGTITNHALAFYTNNAERMRINNAGQISIGTTAATAALNIYGSGITQSIWGGNQQGIGFNSTTNTVGVYFGRGYSSDNANTFFVYNLAANVLQLLISPTGDMTVPGSLSKGSGSFRIDHPLPQLEKTHDLVHSFIEGPQADLIYRGVAKLENGKATVNIDAASGMTEGTFEVLCREVQCFTTNETDWTAVRGSVSGNILTIEAQDNTATSSISWMVIGERKDKHMIDTGWTDENGKVIVEPIRTIQKTMPNPPTTEAGA